jgi:serine/threonine protein phosphatase PrpC
LKVRAGAATDIGLVREGNEDSYLTEEPLFAVADGMGGHRGGEVASQLALETLEDLFRKGDRDLPEQVREANRVVFERSVLDRRVSGMGTTLTAALVDDDRVRIAHVGDSRAYLLRDGELRQLTQDHTLVHRMVEEGEISEAEAETHPQRSVLTRALGVEVMVDVDDRMVEVRPGDRILLCTDGLTSMVGEEEIKEILSSHADPREAADRLVRVANEAGGVDNTTVIVLDFVEDGGTELEGDRGRSASQSPSTPRSPTVAPPAERPARRLGRLAVGTFPFKKLLIWLGAIILALIVGLVGLRFYLDRQWYVGMANGHVAIYRGIPTEVAGFDLHHSVVETTIPARVAESLAVWSELADGITAEDRQRASAIVEQIRRDVDRLQRQQEKQSPSGQPNGSGS